MDLKEAIHKRRPNLSDSSVRTYTSILSSLYKKIWGGPAEDLSKFDDAQAVLHHLKDLPAARRKTVLSALVVLTERDDYRKAMLEDVTVFNKEINSQVMNDKQKASNISAEEVRAIYGRLAAQAAVLYKKKALTVSDLSEIQDMVILALLGGVFIAPRRSLDYCAFKVKDAGDKDNYLDKGALVFHTYKTAKTYGKQEVPCPKPLLALLKKWYKVNPTEWLLFDSHQKPLTSVKLNQRLNRIFGGRKIAVNQLRHTFLSNKYAAFSKEQKEMAADMSAMGSSQGMLNTYVRFE
jgi:integrase